jgi:drug/metabolite transporter (DMT)-like permease
MTLTGWLWIPIVLAAAGVQTIRNAAQRSLVESAGTLAATLVRFLYGLPFTLAALGVVIATSPGGLPAPSALFLAWVALGAVAQLVATAFLIRAMAARSFVVAVTYSKTEIVQIGLFSIALLAEPVTTAAVIAIALASVGVLLLSTKPGAMPGADLHAWLSPSAAVGLASGACFALSAVGYRGAAIALGHPLPWVSGIYALAWAQSLQTLLLGGYLLARERPNLARVLVAWRVSLLAGFTGSLASMGWLTAFAMRSAVDVRIVGLVEVLYSYVLSRRLFAERVSGRETLGIALVVAGIVLVSVR